MARVYISIGSNIDPGHNVRSCIRTLRKIFGPLIISTVYQNKAIGFEGDDFFNLVVGFETTMDAHGVLNSLRRIEAAHHRRRDTPKFSPRTLDLDLLLYEDLILKEGELHVPREEIVRYAFVLRPLAEVAGERCHPVLGSTYKELWEGFDKDSEQLRPVSLDF